MRRHFKRTSAFLLAMVMLVSLLPTIVFADEGPVVTVATDSITLGERNSTNTKETLRTVVVDKTFSVGDEFYIPIKLTSMDTFNAFNLQFSYNTSVLKFIGAYNKLQYWNKDDEEYADFAKTLTQSDSLTVNADAAVVVFSTAEGVSNLSGKAPYNYLFFAKFKVLAKSATGSETVGISSSNAAAGVSMTDVNYADITYVPGTVKVEHDEIVPAGLSFKDGATEYTYDTLHADSYTLTAPGADYYFAGWFTGLTADADGKITVDEDGRYILSSAATEDGDRFSATETRPKYDAAPENGEYHALWVREDEVNMVTMVLEVYEDSISYRKVNYTDEDKEIISNNDVLRAAWATAAGNGRIKLLKDMRVEEFTYKGSSGSDYIAEGFKLDMNGHKLTNLDSSSAVIMFCSGTNAIESSHGQGAIEQTAGSNNGAASVVKTDRRTTTAIRDIDIIGNVEGRGVTGLSIGRSTIGSIENVNIRVSATGTRADPSRVRAIYSSNTDAEGTHLGYMNNVTVESTGYLIDVDKASADLGRITNVTMTSTATTYGRIANSGSITFGSGNKITSASTTLFTGNGELAFTAAGEYSCAEGGDVLADSLKVTATPEDGTIAYNDNGTLTFVEGFTVTFKNYDGSSILWADKYRTGGTPVNHTVEYPITGLDAYEHVGWTKTLGSEELTDPTTLREETTLFAVRKLVRLEAAVSVSIDGGTAAEYATWDLAVASFDYKSWGKPVVIRLLEDASGEAGLKAGYYELTLDLNGHTLTYSGTKALHDYTGNMNTGGAPYFTVTSTGPEKGNLILTGDAGVACSNASFGYKVPVTLNNVRIEAPNLTAKATWNQNGAVVTMINQSKNRTETLTMTDVEIVAANAPAVEFSMASTQGTCLINATFNNVKLSGGTVAVASKSSGNPGATHVNLTVDAASTFKGAADTYPIQETNGNYGLTPSYPAGFALTAGDDGWYSFQPVLSYNDGENRTADVGLDPEITETTVTQITIKNAETLGNFHSLTVENDAAAAVFSADALASIASAASGDVVLTIQGGVTTGKEVKRVTLSLTKDGAPVAFTGPVTVTVPFEPESGKSYVVFFDNAGTLEMVPSTVSGNKITFTTTHFSDYVVMVNEGYDLQVLTAAEHYNAGETFTATVQLTRTEAANIRGYQFELDYDASKLELGTITIDPAFGSEQSINGKKVAGTTGGTGVKIDANGKALATVTFTVKENVTDLSTADITLKNAVTSTALEGQELLSKVTPQTVTLHNIQVTLKSGEHGTLNGAADDITLYAKYNVPGLYSDTARTTAVTSVAAAAAEGYRLADNNWKDEADAEYADFAAIAAVSPQATGKVYTLQTIAQYTVTVAAAEHATTTSTATLFTVDDGTKIPEIDGLPAYTVEDNYTEDSWYVSTDDGATWTKVDQTTYQIQSSVQIKFVAVPKTFTLTGVTDTDVTETKADGITSDGTVTYGTDAQLTYEYTGAEQKVITGVTATRDGTAISVTTAVGADGVWTVTIPGGEITGDITMSVSLSDVYTITFVNGTGVETISGTAYQVNGRQGYYSSMDQAKVGGEGDFTVPTPAAAEGYRLADKTSENLWLSNEATPRGFTADTVSNAAFNSDTTLTAQAVKIWTVTFAPGEHGSFAEDAVTTVTVDGGSDVADALTSAPVAVPEAGYAFTGWDPATGTVTADTTVTAQYQDASYTVTVPTTVAGVTVTPSGAGYDADTQKATHGTDLTITVTVAAGHKVTEVAYTVGNGEKVVLSDDDLTPGTSTFTISGNKIIDAISVTVAANNTYDVTFKSVDASKGGIGNADTEQVIKTFDENHQLTTADIPTPVAKPGYTFVEWSQDFEDTENPVTVTGAVTYTATFADASYTLTKNGTETADGVTHGTDYTFTPEVTDKIVTGVTVTVGGASLTVTADAEGQYTIPGDKITGDVVITYQTVDGEWEFITFEQYMGSKAYHQIAILKTGYQEGSTYRLTGYETEAYYSEKYAGYVWFVYQVENGAHKAETAASLSSKLVSAAGSAAAKLTYENGDLNGSGVVTAADAGIINDVLHQNGGTGVTLVYTVSDKLRFELDVMGDKSVTTQDIQWILDEVVGKSHS